MNSRDQASSQRLGDAERDVAVNQLADGLAAGRLQLQEYEDRLEAALTSRTAGQLAPVVADPPVSPAMEVPHGRTQPAGPP